MDTTTPAPTTTATTSWLGSFGLNDLTNFLNKTGKAIQSPFTDQDGSYDDLKEKYNNRKNQTATTGQNQTTTNGQTGTTLTRYPGGPFYKMSGNSSSGGKRRRTRRQKKSRKSRKHRRTRHR